MKHHHRHRAVYARALRPQGIGRIGCSRLPQLESLKQCEQRAIVAHLHLCSVLERSWWQMSNKLCDQQAGEASDRGAHISIMCCHTCSHLKFKPSNRRRRPALPTLGYPCTGVLHDALTVEHNRFHHGEHQVCACAPPSASQQAFIRGHAAQLSFKRMHLHAT